MRRVEFQLNWELKERLVKLGYPVADGRFSFDLTVNLPLEKRIDLDTKVAKQIDIGESYWRDTYGMPEPTVAEKKSIAERRVASQPPTPDTPPAKKQDTPPEEDLPDRGNTAMHTQLRTLYTRHAHGRAGANVAAEEFTGSDPIMEELARAMHDGRLTDGWADPKLMQWTHDQLIKGLFGDGAIDETATSQSPEVVNMMRENVAYFSGFKTYATLREATDQLLDENGQFRSFPDFRKRISAIDATYNRDYLRAEYQHAVASAQMAERWAEIQGSKNELPYLRYVTAGDDRVRPAHAQLDGVVKKVDDAFWNTHYPPNDWGCRCDVEQTDKGEGARELPANYSDERQGMFKSNVGKDGIVFPKSHPYYNAPAKVADEVAKAVETMSNEPSEELVKAMMKKLGITRAKAIKLIKSGKQ